LTKNRQLRRSLTGNSSSETRVGTGSCLWRSLSAGATLGLLLAAACGGSQLSNTALGGDLPELKKQISDASRAGTLDETETRKLALAVARRELLSSKGDEGVERVRELRPCLFDLVGDFEERASGEDSVAAAANLALLEAGQADDEELFEDYAAASDPMWRSVGIRAAVGPQRAKARSRAFLDGDLRVRRSALHAALAQPNEQELTALLEVARLDPDALTRSVAIRALGALGTQRAVVALRDLWASADDEARQAIVDAWSSQVSASKGGREQVLWVMETQKGLPRVVAAARLARAAGSGLELQAIAVLERTLQSGAVDEQRLAALIAPSHPELLRALEKVAAGSDEDAAVLAAAALARSPAHRAKAREQLLKLSKHQRLWVARQARAALVVMGEQSLAAALTRELTSKRSEQRRQAAIDLLRLGRYSAAATALADDVATVRTQVACQLLASR
jgi:HEAT repeat protein